MLMVKPALPYLDILQRVRAETTLPLCAYQVSGEYSMILAAAERGWIDGDRAMREALTSIRRAGADLIVTYYARQFARRIGLEA
jgi:porphobilinogen synthase